MSLKTILYCCVVTAGTITPTHTMHYNLHVFVHGTYFSGVALTSAIPTLTNTLKDYHLYPRALRAARAKQVGFDACVILQEGLVQIPERIITQCRDRQLSPEESRLGAYQIITAYDQFARHLNVINRYYTFGWTGLLDAEYRKQAATKLYTSLIKLRDSVLYQDPAAHIDFILHGHSHGGNVILNLAHCENAQKQGLAITATFLYGTPIQQETADCCLHPLFGTIVNIASNGDSIQTADRFSTKGRSKRYFADYVSWKNTPKHTIVDTTIRLNGNDSAFGHASLFYLDDIAYKMNSDCDAVRPLPVVAYAPLIDNLVRQTRTQTDNQRLFLDFLTNGSCTIHVSDEKRGSLAHTSDLRPQLANIRQTVAQTWHPYARSGYIKDALRATGHAIALAPKTIYENYIQKK